MASLVDFAQTMGQQATDVTKGLAGLAETKRLTDYQQQQIGIEQQRFGLAQQEQRSMFDYRKAEMENMQKQREAQMQQLQWTIDKGHADEALEVHNKLGTYDSFSTYVDALAKIGINIPKPDVSVYDNSQMFVNRALSGLAQAKTPAQKMMFLSNAIKEFSKNPGYASQLQATLLADQIKLVHEQNQMDMAAMRFTGQIPGQMPGQLPPSGSPLDNLKTGIEKWNINPSSIRPINRTMLEQTYPGFDFNKYEAGSKIYANPKMQDFMGRTESIIQKGGALDMLKSQRDLTPDTGSQSLNKLVNTFEAQFGDAAVEKLRTQGIITADEASKLMGSGQGAVEYFKAAQDMMKTAGTKEQVAAVVENLRDNLKNLYLAKGRDTKFETRFDRLGIVDPYRTQQQPLAAQQQYSQEDLEHTAKLRGMTVEQVKQRLGVK